MADAQSQHRDRVAGSGSAARLGLLFAPIIIARMVFGFALIGMSKEPDKFEATDPFAWTAVVVLAVLLLDGPLILGRHGERRGHCRCSGGASVTELRAMTLDRTSWYVGHMNSFAALGVVLNMATKPSVVWCIVDIVVRAGIGVAIAQFRLSRAAPPASQRTCRSR